ncbi:prevent-host-death family protein [Schaalia sp. 19OD2882]|nr:prevent-host-death family protein [Schaalia sp. 19OD2882]
MRFTPGPAQQDAPAPVDPVLEEAIVRWRAELEEVARASTDSDAPRLTITSAHPGGLAQLYADHPTRLSNLVREPRAHARALERAHTVILRAEDLTARHGIGPVHLAIGRAAWTQDGRRVSSPTFLRPVALERVDGDVVVTLRPGTVLAPALTAALAECGVTLDLHQILADARSVHGFSASRALAHVREAAAVLERFDLVEDLILGIFEHPAGTLLRELGDPAPLLASPLVRALAGDRVAREDLQVALPEPVPGDRDPWAEIGAGDLDPRQQDVVEAVSAGHSLVVDVPGGADETSVLGAILADAASRGRTALHVAGNPSRTTRAEQRLRDLGLDEIGARIDSSAQSASVLAERLRAALEDNSSVTDREATDAMRTRLVEVRRILADHTAQLHAPFREFGVSAFDALQVLTDLTSSHPAPRTRVRLRENVLLDIASDQGERARTLLHRAHSLGLFSVLADHSAWKGIVINSAEQVEEVLRRVSRLAAETLPVLRVHMNSVASETGVRPAHTLRQWEEQLEMFEGVRDVLDTFQPRVFERPAADMAIAAASRQWRKEHGITMPRGLRVRLVKQAQDLVRPGAHVKDLHAALSVVQERRELWREHCDSDGWPTLPQRMDEILEVTRSVREDLDKLAPAFATSHPDLPRTPVADLARLFDRLAADTDAARALPARIAVLTQLSKAGLDDLVQDLRGRRVDAEVLDAELDLAWWASVLGLMIAEEPALGGFDPLHLEDTLEEGRRLDLEQVHSLTPKAIDSLRRIRAEILARNPEHRLDLEVLLGRHLSAPDLHSRSALTAHMVPVSLTVPTIVPWMLPAVRRVDLLVLDDVDRLPLAELVPIIARARQVVLLADVSGARPGGPVEALAGLLPRLRAEVTPDRLNDQVALLLSRHGIAHTGVPVPWTSVNAPVTAVWSEGSGMPAPGASCVESTSQEVDQVVEEVLAHAVEQPERSLAVIALNERHADRIRKAIDRALVGQPALASFFSSANLEPFTVVGPRDAKRLSRDRVVISVGFAKTPHGRVLHDFGEISAPGGLELLAGALGTVRGDLTLVSSLRAGEIDRSRITVEGAQLLVDLLEIAEGQSGEGEDAWPVLETAPDRLLVDLAERLYGMGLDVVPNVGIQGGVRIPLAIGHPEVPGRLLVAVLTDDETYVAEPSLRVRDRLRPAMLEAQGWKVHMVLSLPVFIDPAKEAEAIVQTVLDAVDEAHGPAAPPVEVPVVVEDDEVDDGTEAVEPRLSAQEEGAVDEDRSADQGGSAVAVAEDGASLAGPDDAAETGAHRERADALRTRIAKDEAARERAHPEHLRGPRPSVARGLPLAAYGDDQLDELALWVASDGVERSPVEFVEELRRALGLSRRGVQTDAVLGNVVRRILAARGSGPDA